MTTFTQHNEWQDSLADWAEHQHFERERLNAMKGDFTMSGRHECETYGECNDWPNRRGGIAFEPRPPVDRVREAWDREDQSESADAEVGIWLLKGLAFVLAVMFCAWVVAGGGYA